MGKFDSVSRKLRLNARFGVDADVDLTAAIDHKLVSSDSDYHSTESSDDETGGAFTANPAEDIPRNKLTEKLARGLQSYV